MKSPVKAKGWPPEITWLDKPHLSAALSSDQVENIRRDKMNVDAVKVESPCANVQIRNITNPTHPACGQRGLFAAQHLEADSLILPYYGYTHGESEANGGSDYDLSLDRDVGISVDAADMGNEARFINDYRGVPDVDGANADFRDVWIDVGDDEAEKCISICALPAGKKGKRAGGIKKGDEILVSYGKGFWQARVQ